MLRALHLDVLLLIVVTVVVCIMVVSATTDLGTFSGGVGVPDDSVVTWGGDGLGAGLADVEATPEAEATEETAVEATETAGDE